MAHHVCSLSSPASLGDGAAVDKKALVRASKHTDKCYDNLVGQARMDRSVDYIKLNKQSALYDLVSQTAGMYGIIYIWTCMLYYVFCV